MQDFTIVTGVDSRTLRQLAVVWPTWVKHKPSLLQREMLVFWDKTQLDQSSVLATINHPRLRTHSWPPDGVEYPDTGGKWGNGQRAKMLAGFVYVPPFAVRTPWWLKIDTDVVATGMDDWVDNRWFFGTPSYIAPPWGYTVGAGLINDLDNWADRIVGLVNYPRLNIPFDPSARVVTHRRMCSWASFYNTAWSAEAASHAPGFVLPVPSQDTYHWFIAARTGRFVAHVNMRACGWKVCGKLSKLEAVVNDAMRL